MVVRVAEHVVVAVVALQALAVLRRDGASLASKGAPLKIARAHTRSHAHTHIGRRMPRASPTLFFFGARAPEEGGRRTGVAGLVEAAVQTLRTVPGVDALIQRVLEGEVAGAVKTLNPADGATRPGYATFFRPERTWWPGRGSHAPTRLGHAAAPMAQARHRHS